MNLYYDKVFFISFSYELTISKHFYALACIDMSTKMSLQYHVFKRNYFRTHT